MKTNHIKKTKDTSKGKTPLNLFLSCHGDIAAFSSQLCKSESKIPHCWTASKSSSTSTKASFYSPSRLVYDQFTATRTSHYAIPSSKSGAIGWSGMVMLRGCAVSVVLLGIGPRSLIGLYFPYLFLSHKFDSLHSMVPVVDIFPCLCFLAKSVAAIVFGDGSDTRLYPLTKRRSEGAIPIAAKYRLIDAVVSNCINSNINKIYALTQFNSTSLNSHLTRAYSGVGLGKEGFVEVIAAYQSPEDKRWFQGTADAIRRCLWMLEEYPIVEFLVLPGNHLYKMDYRKLIESHRNKKADVTCAVLTSMRNQESKFGIFKVNFENKVMEFRDKPEKNPVESTSAESTGKSSDSAYYNSPGMGIYVINRDAMIKLLKEYFPKASDLRGEVIPGAISVGMKVHAYCFDGYWEDMRSIEAYYQANMESTKKANMGYKSVALPGKAETERIKTVHPFSEYFTHNDPTTTNTTSSFHSSFDDEDSPLYTMPRCLPPSLITDAVITDSVIGDGCILNRCNIKGTVVGLRTKVGDGAVIEDSILMGSDIYQTQDVQMEDKDAGIPIGIGEGSHIRKAIVDKNARIGKNVMIINKDNIQEANMEAYGYIIKEGIVVIVRSAAIPDGSIL